MRNYYWLLLIAALFVVIVIAACSQISPLTPAAVNDPHWAKAQGTTNAQVLTTEANYQAVQGTANAATHVSALVRDQATSTHQAHQTADSLQVALTVDSATTQAQETHTIATSQAIGTATAQAHINTLATSTAAALATQDTFRATEQAYALEQEETQARRGRAVSIAFMILMIGAATMLVILLGWFIWRAIPLLINRLGIFRYGQHQNPLLLTVKENRTVITDPLKMLQASLTISEQAEAFMQELTPNQLQALLANGQLYHLIEQTRHAPGHPPHVPYEVIRKERQNGRMTTTT